MRITETHMIKMAAQNIMDARKRVSEAQDPMATGMRVSKPSDDPAAWAAGRRTEARLVLNESFGRAIASTKERMSETERIFEQVGSALVRAKELSIQAANDSLGAAERAAMALEVRSLRDGALGVANEQAVDGEYLLAGTQGETVPFDAFGTFQGDAIQRQAEISNTGRLVSILPGERLTAANGVDVFTELENFAVALEANDVPGIQVVIGALDQAIEQTSRARTEIGAIVNSLSLAESARQDLDLVLAEIRHRLVESDPIVAASDLARGSAGLEAAQVTAAEIMELVRNGLTR